VQPGVAIEESYWLLASLRGPWSRLVFFRAMERKKAVEREVLFECVRAIEKIPSSGTLHCGAQGYIEQAVSMLVGAVMCIITGGSF